MELEPPKTPETPSPTPILLSSSPDPLIEETAETLHVQVGPKPFATSQNIVPQKRGGGNSMITPERLRLSRPAPAMRFQFQKQSTTTLPDVQTVKEAIRIARSMVLQASTLAETNQEQTKLLDLLEIFRNYTETGRVAREEIASNKMKTYADAAKPTKTYAEATGPNTATYPNNTTQPRSQQALQCLKRNSKQQQPNTRRIQRKES
jgi:hypothetical protein